MSYAIAAAGTGGHVYPGLAVGEALVEAGVDRSDILFVGGDRLDQLRYRVQVYVVWLVVVFSALIDALVRLGCVLAGTIDQIGHHCIPVFVISNPGILNLTC